MKITKFFPLLFLPLLLCGCGGVFKKTVSAVPMVSRVVVTNTVRQVVTDQEGNSTTNVTLVLRENVATNWVTNVTYAVNPAVEHFIGTAQTVAESAPVPYGHAVNVALGLLASGLAWVAKKKSDKAKILPAVIAGVESAGSPETKKRIQEFAMSIGVEKELNDLVKHL